MSSTWEELGRDGQARLLLQLNKKGLLFDKYTFTMKEDKLHLLGFGGQGVVYEAEAKSGQGKNYAIKVSEVIGSYNSTDKSGDIVNWQKLLGGSVNHILKIVALKELYIWLDGEANLLKAEKTTKYEDIPFDVNVFCLQFMVMEKLEPVIGNSGIISTLEKYNENEVLKLAHEIGIALEALHKKNILHLDIKLANIFYSPNEKQYYLGDFGVGEVTSDGVTSGKRGTEGYAAPEVLARKKYDCTADIYSLGIAMYRLMNNLQCSEYDENGARRDEQGYILPTPKNGSAELFAIIKKMCEYDPDDRYQSMAEVLNNLEELLFGIGTKRKREQKNSYLAVGLLFALTGIGMWKWSFAPQLQLDLSLPVYIFLILCAGKVVLSEYKKVEQLVNLTIFFLGIYLMFSTGFTWWKAVLWLFMWVSSGKFSCLAGGGILMVDIVGMMTRSNSSLAEAGQSYYWLAVTLLTLAVWWLVQYYILSIRNMNMSQKTDVFVVRMYLRKNIFTLLICAYYISTFTMGDLIEKSAKQQELITMLEENDAIIKTFYNINPFYNVIYDTCQKWGIWDDLVKCDLKKVGIAGLLFGGFWLVRDWTMHNSKKLKKQK